MRVQRAFTIFFGLPIDQRKSHGSKVLRRHAMTILSCYKRPLVPKFDYTYKKMIRKRLSGKKTVISILGACALPGNLHEGHRIAADPGDKACFFHP